MNMVHTHCIHYSITNIQQLINTQPGTVSMTICQVQCHMNVKKFSCLN